MTTAWFRSWHGAPTDPKWLVVAAKAGVAPGIVSAIAWALFDHASQSGERGDVSGFDVETYAAFSGFDPTQVEAVLKALNDKGVIINNRLSAWDRRQPAREDFTARARQRAKRERDRASRPTASRRVTPGHTPSHVVTAQSRTDTDTDTEQRREEQKEKESPSLRSGGTRARARPGHRLPDDWDLLEADWTFARTLFGNDSRILAERDKFRDYWRAANGRSSVKRDWSAAWRNWSRKALEMETRHGDRPRSRNSNPADQNREGFAAYAARLARKAADGDEPGD